MQIHCVRSLLQSVHRAETFICAEDCAAPAAGANGLHSPLATLQDGGAVLTRSAAHGRTMMSHPARRDTARAASFDRRATGDLTKTVEAKLGEISAGGCRRSRRSRQTGKPRLGGVRVPDGPGSVRRGRAMPVPACVVVLPPTPRMVRRSRSRAARIFSPVPCVVAVTTPDILQESVVGRRPRPAPAPPAAPFPGRAGRSRRPRIRPAPSPRLGLRGQRASVPG